MADPQLFLTLFILFGAAQTVLSVLLFYFQYRMITTRDCRRKRRVQASVDTTLTIWTIVYIAFIAILRMNLVSTSINVSSMTRLYQQIVFTLKILIILVGLIGVFFNHDTSFAYDRQKKRIRPLFLLEILIMTVCGIIAGGLYILFTGAYTDMMECVKIVGITVVFTLVYYLVFEFSGFHRSLLTDISPVECSSDRPSPILKGVMLSACAVFIVISVGFLYAAPLFLTLINEEPTTMPFFSKVSHEYPTAVYIAKWLLWSITINVGYIFIYRNRNIGKRKVFDMLFWLRWSLVVIKTTLIASVISVIFGGGQHEVKKSTTLSL